MGARHSWVASRTQAFAALQDQVAELRATPLRAEQTNSSVNLGDRLLLKFFRKAEAGVNPDLEIGRFLTEHTGFRRIPLLAGGLELRARNREPVTIGVLHQFVPGEGDAWGLALNALGQYFERALVASAPPNEAELAPIGLVDLAVQETPARIEELTGPFLAQVGLLGQRTAEMHVALASSTEHPAFAPEPFTAMYRRSLYQSSRSAVRTTFDLLRRRLPTLNESLQHQAHVLIGMEEPLLRRIRAVTDRKLVATRIRIHGDYHLGQVLNTGRDFVILDFEGEPSRSISERRFKRSPLRDVAGMIRSFEYAAAYGLQQGPTRAEDAPALAPWSRLWRRWASARFLHGYLGIAADAGFLPPSPDDLRAMLELYLIDKTVYELRYELNNRPEWVGIPLQALLRRAEPETARMVGAAT
jgi:maltose alpha-D-glucosyltransferase / alpha-amylase